MKTLLFDRGMAIRISNYIVIFSLKIPFLDWEKIIGYLFLQSD
jgi:hypothetical protein